MSFLMVHPDGLELNYATLGEVFAAERARCPGHQFEAMEGDAQVVTNVEDIDVEDFEGCSLCGAMRRKIKPATK